MVQRAERLALLDRYVAGRKIRIMCTLPGNVLYEFGKNVDLFYVDDVLVFHEATNPESVHPSDALMATLALAIGATNGFGGIPAVEPTHEVSEGGKRYNAELRARNAGRLDFA